MTDLLVSTQGFTATVNGRFVSVKPGEIAHRDAAIVRGRRNFFKPLEVRHPAAVEEATAEPGRPRATTLPKTAPAVSDKPYDGFKQKDFKDELDKRGIDYPSGVVSNAKLRELLEADDAA